MQINTATVMAGLQILFGTVIFTSRWWLSADQQGTGLLVFGFITVLVGVFTAVLLTPKSDIVQKRRP